MGMQEFLDMALDEITVEIVISVLMLILSPILIYFRKYMRSQYKFGRNLRRKIYFLRTSGNKNLQVEKDCIKEIGFFNVDKDIRDISGGLKVLQSLKGKAVYVVGYESNYQYYADLIEHAKSKNILILIIAKQKEVKEEYWEIFDSYIYCDVVNTTNRMVIILLNMLKIV